MKKKRKKERKENNNKFVHQVHLHEKSKAKCSKETLKSSQFFSPRIIMKFQIQWMNKKEARWWMNYEPTMGWNKMKWMTFYMWTNIRPQTYIYGWQHVYGILNPRSPFFPYGMGRAVCGVISWYLRLLLWKKNICCLWYHMITHPDSEPKQIIF